jgi:oligopeptide/dipeptide ABC transporter ATP-binding protein
MMEPIEPRACEDRLLEVRGLKTWFYTEDGVVKAVDGVDLAVSPGEIVGLVGESGCGKSVTSFSIMRLVGVPGKIVGGEILFEGQNLLQLPEADMMRLRGNRISMIFQQPTSCLNPVFKVGDQVSEVLKVHQQLNKAACRARSIELLKLVGIPEAEKRVDSYPQEMSGGMAQRVMIAMALACTPELLIADEPTTALDVTIQAQILDLLLNLRAQTNTSIILITHDLGIVAEMCERVAVMYAGRMVEQADVQTLFLEPLHPYTLGLIGSVPVLGQVKGRLDVIPGSVPNLVDLPPGCKFAPRCRARVEHGLEVCTRSEPELRLAGPGHQVRCWLYQ